MRLSDETKMYLEWAWYLIKVNWYLIPYTIIMVWGIIATFAQYGAG